MNIALFALTGVGNDVLGSLLAHGHTVQFLVTRKEPGPFPHYPCRQITEMAEHNRIPVHYDYGPPIWGADLLLSATFHKLISADTRAKARFAVNLHPSLLPKHPGKNPFKAALDAGDTVTGVTAHKLSDTYDGGEIIFKFSHPIEPGTTEGQLRMQLATVSAEAASYLAHGIGRGLAA